MSDNFMPCEAYPRAVLGKTADNGPSRPRSPRATLGRYVASWLSAKYSTNRTPSSFGFNVLLTARRIAKLLGVQFSKSMVKQAR